jgi:hypothetical protein
MNTRDKGDLAVLAVATDLMKRGYKVAIPFGDSWEYDLLVMMPEMKRIQVKYTESNGEVIIARTRSHSVLAGRVTKTKTYNEETVDVIAIYDKTTDRCIYIPISECAGKDQVMIRLVPPKNGRKTGIRWVEDYLTV